MAVKVGRGLGTAVTPDIGTAGIDSHGVSASLRLISELSLLSPARSAMSASPFARSSIVSDQEIDPQ